MPNSFILNKFTFEYLMTIFFKHSWLNDNLLIVFRFPEMFWYLVQVSFSRTEAESPAIQRAVTYEFRSGSFMSAQ